MFAGIALLKRMPPVCGPESGAPLPAAIIRLGRSSTAMLRHPGTPVLDEGAAKNALDDWLMNAPVSVPVEVTGEPEIEKVDAGSASATLVTATPDTSAATSVPHVGVAAPPEVGPRKNVLADCVFNANVKAGVVVAVATLVVNSGDRLPALNEVTLPAPTAEITPADMVVVVPSGLTAPNRDVVASGRSVPTIVLNPGVPVTPFGAAKKVLAVCSNRAAENVTTPFEGAENPMLYIGLNGDPVKVIPVTVPCS